MAAFNDRESIHAIINKYVNLLEKKYSVKFVYLFGSRVQGNADFDSDIDMAVIADDFTGDPVEDRLSLMRIRRNVDLRIEPVPFLTKDFVPDNPFVSEILEKGVRIR
ncbi:MAG TPA: nucleotidyltransferase domain-containing protein [Spirochaetota bacterium]|nr:nucleotidyltransferase domain-containing protein [Spirochaetota bacterium]